MKWIAVLLALMLAQLGEASVRPGTLAASSVSWDLRLIGAQVAPPVDSPLAGTVSLQFQEVTGILHFTLNISGVAREALAGADLYVNGPVGRNGQRKYALLAASESNARGELQLEGADVPGLLRGDHYVEVRSSIRGTLARAQVEAPVKTVYRMDVNARNSGDASAVESLYTEDARQVWSSGCTPLRPCLTRDGVRRDVELAALRNLRLTPLDIQTDLNSLTVREEWRDDLIRAAGVERVIVTSHLTFKDLRILSRVQTLDVTDGETAAYLQREDDLLGSHALSAAQQPLIFVDDFDRSGLDREWTWENPGRTSAYAVSGHRFNLVVAPGNDQWAGVDAGPRILRSQPPGPWSLDTKLAYASNDTSAFGGLLLFSDPDNWLAFGWLQGKSLELSGVVSGAFTQPVGISGWFEYLRLRRAGNRYYADASIDGRNWTNVNVFIDSTVAFNNARVGFLGKNWGDDAYQVSLEYMRAQQYNPMPSLLKRVLSTRLIEQATGEDAANRTQNVNVCGTDLGITFDWRGLAYFVFGDTMGCSVADRVLPNTLAFSSDTEPEDGLLLDGWVVDPQGKARPLVERDAGGVTAIPTAAIAIGTSAYVFYMNVIDWLPWNCNHSGVASAEEAPDRWTKQRLRWGQGNFNQLAVVRDHDPASTTLYFLGTPCGRKGSIKLMKVDQAGILDKTAYRYLSGTDAEGSPQWSASEADAVTVAGGPAGEMSVVFNQALGRYVLTYLDEAKAAIVLREAEMPWGPWSAPVIVASADRYAELYGAFVNPRFIRDDGRRFYYLMSLFGPYNAYWMETVLPLLSLEDPLQPLPAQRRRTAESPP